MLKSEIIPQLEFQVKGRISKEMLELDKSLDIFTIVFDREGYSPKYFGQLWQKRIAVITYCKNVKDQWKEDDFKEYQVKVDGVQTKMILCEKEVELDSVKMREVRRLTDSRPKL